MTVSPGLAGLSVTVIGIYYAPDSTGIAPYTTDLCETLAAAGARVTAVVGVPHYPGWTVEAPYRWRPWVREYRDGVAVHRVRHFVPRSQDTARRALYEGSFYLAARAATQSRRPDLVIGVTPNLGGAAAAAALASRRGVPLGIVVQDLVGQAARQSGIRGGAGVAEQVARMEAAVLRRADRLAVISSAFEAPLRRMGVPSGRLVRLPNHSRLSPVAADRDRARRALGWPVDRRIVVHSGNMGLKQGLESVVAAARLAAARQDDLLFVLVGNGSTRPRLRRLAAGLDTVRFVDPLPDADYPLCLAAADALLLHERGSVLDMSLPSKLTSYLAAGRPVVAATPAGGATAAELARCGAAVLVEPEQPGALLDAVGGLLADPARSAELTRSGLAYAAAELSADAARERVLDFARVLLAGRVTPVSTGATRPG